MAIVWAEFSKLDAREQYRADQNVGGVSYKLRIRWPSVGFVKLTDWIEVSCDGETLRLDIRFATSPDKHSRFMDLMCGSDAEVIRK